MLTAKNQDSAYDSLYEIVQSGSSFFLLKVYIAVQRSKLFMKSKLFILHFPKWMILTEFVKRGSTMH